MVGTLPLLKAGTYKYHLTFFDLDIENEAFKSCSGVRHTICTVNYKNVYFHLENVDWCMTIIFIWKIGFCYGSTQ